MRSNLARSTFKIFPLSGKIAWNFRLRPCFAEPPAESPSTMKSSESAGSFSWQSANFPGRPAISNALLRRVFSRALRAASRAIAASIIFEVIALASSGLSSKNSSKRSANTLSTTGRTSLDTSFSFVCDENFGPGIFTEIIAVRPSRASSPVVAIFAFFKRPSSCI